MNKFPRRQRVFFETRLNEGWTFICIIIKHSLVEFNFLACDCRCAFAGSGHLQALHSNCQNLVPHRDICCLTARHVLKEPPSGDFLVLHVGTGYAKGVSTHTLADPPALCCGGNLRSALRALCGHCATGSCPSNN